MAREAGESPDRPLRLFPWRPDSTMPPFLVTSELHILSPGLHYWDPSAVFRAECDEDVNGDILEDSCRLPLSGSHIPAWWLLETRPFTTLSPYRNPSGLTLHPWDTWSRFSTSPRSKCASAVECVRGNAGSLPCMAPWRFTLLPTETVFGFTFLHTDWNCVAMSAFPESTCPLPCPLFYFPGHFQYNLDA